MTVEYELTSEQMRKMMVQLFYYKKRAGIWIGIIFSVISCCNIFIGIMGYEDALISGIFGLIGSMSVLVALLISYSILQKQQNVILQYPNADGKLKRKLEREGDDYTYTDLIRGNVFHFSKAEISKAGIYKETIIVSMKALNNYAFPNTEEIRALFNLSMKNPTK
ncbi:MAG: hypothetical protein J6D37_09335 [Clostridia bacterium]|nr:hypothetical protein [Clostridia bacterium]